MKLIVVVLTVMAVWTSPMASAQDWPTRPIRIIAPSTPGGAADMFARILCDHFGEVFAQRCFVENRAGAGGMIGTSAAAQSEPDGYTLTISSLAYHVIAPATAAKPAYDPIKDFTHVAYIGGPANVFVVNPKSGITSLPELAAFGRRSGPLPFVSPGVGTLGHLLMERFASKEDLQTQLILTKGASQAMIDLVAGNVNVGSMTWTSALGQLRSNLVRPIAISSSARLNEFPDLPTFADLGRPDLTAVSWFALSAPAGLPASIARRLNREVGVVLEKSDVKARFERDAVQTRLMSPEDFTKFLQSETETWAPLARQLLPKSGGP